jgi:peptidoglycan-N-acetylglucosamine deacetylase
VSAPRRIAVVPAYNEEPTVAAVLEQLYPLVDELVVVDDGSTDATRAEIERWMDGRAHCQLLVHDVNQGMSEAYYTALTALRDRFRSGELAADDLVFTVDADGQHDLDVLNDLVQVTLDEGLDANVARRDLSYHGAFKRFGNWVVSQWASLWAACPLHDVESGYRIFRLGALVHALDYYSGYKYSETVEVAVVLCQLGYKVRNDQLVPVPVARSRTSMRDAVIDVAVIPVAAMRVWRGEPRRDTLRTDVIAHIAIASIFAVLCALTYAKATETITTIVCAALGAFVLGALIRRYVPRPSLAFVGLLVALVAAWLVPQRPDTGSAIVLVSLFGIGAALAAPPIRRPRPSWLGAAIAVLVVVRIGGTRATLLALAVLAVGVAAIVARWVWRGTPHVHRLRTIAIGSTLVVVTLGITGYFGASTVGASWFGGGVRHGPRESGQVAITFDDGPNTHTTPAVMKILDDAGVKGTFFLVGKAIEEQPQIARELNAHGHLLGNHSYSHGDWTWLDPRYPELEETQDVFADEVGVCPVWFRPPHGQRTPMMRRVVHSHDMRIAMWDVSVADWATDDAHRIAEKVLARVQPGSIIDLHDGFDGDPEVDRMVVAQALPEILAGLRAKNLAPVRLDELVGGGDYQPCPTS